MEFYNNTRRWGMPTNWMQLPAPLIEALIVIEDAVNASSVMDTLHKVAMDKVEESLHGR